MTDQEIADAAALLANARRTGTWFDHLPITPTTVAEAHAIQDRVAALIGAPIGGFKANAPPGEPSTRGLIEARTIRPTPAHVPAAEAPHRGVEGEIAFRFTRDFPPSPTPYTREQIVAAVIPLPAIEIVSGRTKKPSDRPALEQLADSIVNAGLITGPETPDWSNLDLPNLHVTLLVNDTPVHQSKGGHSINDPLGIAVALVNMMRDTTGITAGQVVTTGSWTGLRFLNPGDTCTVRFESLGEATVAFAA